MLIFEPMSGKILAEKPGKQALVECVHVKQKPARAPRRPFAMVRLLRQIPLIIRSLRCLIATFMIAVEDESHQSHAESQRH